MTHNQPCPRCGGNDRYFLVQRPRNGGPPFWLCRQCHYHEGASESDPAIPIRILSPEEITHAHGAYAAFASWAAEYLWSNQPDAQAALAYLHQRGLNDQAIRDAGIGYHPIQQERGAGTALYRTGQMDLWDAAQLGGLLGPQGRLKSVLRGTITIPYWIAGRCTLLRGRTLEGPARYLSPSGVGIYAGGVPSLFMADTLSTEDTVLLCEGEFKALAAHQAGIPAVAQPGVGYFPDAFLHALANKTVVVAYDVEARQCPFTASPGERYTLAVVGQLCGLSQQERVGQLHELIEKLDKGKPGSDREEIMQVFQIESAKAEIERLKQQIVALAKLKIRVKVLRLPRRADESKVDLDGWLLRNSAETLQDLVRAAPDGRDWYAAHSGGEYAYTSRGMSNGVQIANYKARIVETLYIHDGQATTTKQRLALATPSGRRLRVDIADEDWADDRRALKAVRIGLCEGTFDDKPADALRAIRLLSNHGDPPVDRRIYTATGWERIDGNWYYLVPDGAIGREGINPVIRAEIDAEAAGNHYALCGPGDPQRGAAAWLNFLRGEVCPQPLALLLAGQAMLALIHRFSGNAARSMVWLHHQTGSFKTALTRAGVMALWGPTFTAERADAAPVIKWDATSPALQFVSYYFRDAALLIDDFKSGMISPDGFRKFVHSYSEGTSRTRATKTLSIDKQRPARAIVFSTAEDIPQGDPGMQARLLSLVLKPETINEDNLASLQRAGADGHLAAFWRSLIQRLASELDTYGAGKIEQGLQSLIRADEDAPKSNHRRTAGALRQNRAAWLLLSAMLREAGHISEAEASALNEAHLSARQLLTADLNDRQNESRPSQIFLSVLRELLSSGELVIEHEGLTCSRCDAEMKRSRDGWFCTGVQCNYHLPASKIVGFDLPEGIGIFAQKAFREVSKVRNDQRQPFAYSSAAIWQQLDADGVLVQRDQTSGKPQVTRRNPANRLPNGHSKPETVLLIRHDCVITPDSEPEHVKHTNSCRSRRSQEFTAVSAHQEAENGAEEESITSRSQVDHVDHKTAVIDVIDPRSTRVDHKNGASGSAETARDRMIDKNLDITGYRTIPARPSVHALADWRQRALDLLRDVGTPRELMQDLKKLTLHQLEDLCDQLEQRKAC